MRAFFLDKCFYENSIFMEGDTLGLEGGGGAKSQVRMTSVSIPVHLPLHYTAIVAGKVKKLC